MNGYPQENVEEKQSFNSSCHLGETRRRQGEGEKLWTAKNKYKHMFKSVFYDIVGGVGVGCVIFLF